MLPILAPRDEPEQWQQHPLLTQRREASYLPLDHPDRPQACDFAR